MKIAYNSIDCLVVQEFQSIPEFEHILVSDEVQTKIDYCLKPKLLNGEIIEAATPEEIEQAEAQRCKPVVSRMIFFRNVWRVLQLTEEDILAEVETIEDLNERVEIRNMVRNASEFERQHPDLLAMANKMGITTQVLNQIFQ